MKNKTLAFIALNFIAINIAVSQDTKDTINLSPVEIKESVMKKVPYISCDISKLQLQAAPTRDIGDYLRSIPNVSGIRKGGASIDPVVRGLKFSQLNIILNNGIKIENGCPNRMDPVSSHVEAEDIEKIEVIKGPYSLRYGQCFGGVINLVTEKPQPYDTFQIHANALYGFETNRNGQKQHVSVYGGNRKVFFLFSGGYRDYGNYKSGKIDGKDTTFNSSFTKYNYNAKLGFAVKQNQNIIFSYNGIHGKDVLYPALPMDEKSDDTRIVAVDYNAKNISKTIKALDIKIYRSDVNHIMDNSQRPGYSTKQMIAEVNAVNTGGRAEITLLQKKHSIIAGLDYENIYKDGTRTMTMQMMGTTSVKKANLWNEAIIRNTGLFAEYNTDFSNYELNAVVRGDYNTATSGDTFKLEKNETGYFNDVNSKFVNLSASVGITKKINDRLSLSLAIGRGVRSPNMLERYIKLLAAGYDDFDYLGNPKLKPEKNNEADITLKYSKERVGNIYINGFYSYVQDYISAVRLSPSVIMAQTSTAPGVKQFVNTDYVTLTGFELGYTSSDKYKMGGSIVAAYTYGAIPEDAKYIMNGGQVTGETTVSNDALSEIPPFETTISINCKFLKGALIPKITLRAVADQRHVSLAFYEPYTPGFYLLNFSAKYKVNKFAEIMAGVDNIFDRVYYEHLNRKMFGAKSGKLYEPGRVFFINLLVKI